MRVYPLTGINITKPYNILFKIDRMPDGYGIPDYVTICPVESLESELKSDHHAIIIKSQYPNTKTYAITTSHLKSIGDVYNIRIALSIIYTAHILYMSRDRRDVEQQIYTINPFYCDCRIGTQHYNENDFSFNVPYYDLDPDDHYSQKSTYIESDLIIEELDEEYSFKSLSDDSFKIIEENIKKKQAPFGTFKESLQAVNSLIDTKHPLRDKFMAAFNFMYYTIPHTDLTLTTIIYSSILETLLLKNRENSKKVSVAFRTACLVEFFSPIEDKQSLATIIAKMYELRSNVVHNGEFVFEIDNNNLFLFNSIRSAIILLIKRFITLNINSHEDIQAIVKGNLIQDGLNTGTQYLKN